MIPSVVNSFSEQEHQQKTPGSSNQTSGKMALNNLWSAPPTNTTTEAGVTTRCTPRPNTFGAERSTIRGGYFVFFLGFAAGLAGGFPLPGPPTMPAVVPLPEPPTIPAAVPRPFPATMPAVVPLPKLDDTRRCAASLPTDNAGCRTLARTADDTRCSRLEPPLAPMMPITMERVLGLTLPTFWSRKSWIDFWGVFPLACAANGWDRADCWLGFSDDTN